MNAQPGVRSTYKFFGEQSAEYHRGELSWPGIYGLPFRSPPGSPPPLFDENTYSKLYCAGDACHATFDLSDSKQSQMYCWVRDRIRNGWFVLDYIERHWDPEKKAMIIYMEWTQLYVQLHTPPQEGK